MLLIPMLIRSQPSIKIQQLLPTFCHSYAKSCQFEEYLQDNNLQLFKKQQVASKRKQQQIFKKVNKVRQSLDKQQKRRNLHKFNQMIQLAKRLINAGLQNNKSNYKLDQFEEIKQAKVHSINQSKMARQQFKKKQKNQRKYLFQCLQKQHQNLTSKLNQTNLLNNNFI